MKLWVYGRVLLLLNAAKFFSVFSISNALYENLTLTPFIAELSDTSLPHVPLASHIHTLGEDILQ